MRCVPSAWCESPRLMVSLFLFLPLPSFVLSSPVLSRSPLGAPLFVSLSDTMPGYRHA